MEVKKYDKIILDSTRSIDDIVAGIKAELSKQESGNAGESYICYVSHAYSSGDNAGVNYIVVSDDFKNLNGLSSNVIKASAYTKDEINELIAREVNEINSTLTDAINSNIANIQSSINQVISSDVTPIGVYKNVENKTVGANGDFKTIQEAFIYVQTRQKQGVNQGMTLTLIEDLNNPLLYFRGAWYPYLTIDCNGFILANKLTIDLSCFFIKNLKLNDRMVAASSLLWLSGNINIQYTNSDYPGGCITALTNTLINVSCKNCNFSAPSDRSAFYSYGNSMIFVTDVGGGSITQTSGSHCFAVSDGGIIQTYDGLNLNGVTVPKASIAANTITRHGIIFGNYTL